MLFFLMHGPNASALVTAMRPSGHSVGEASLIKIRFSRYTLSYSLAFLNHANPTSNRFSFRRAVTNCNYTLMTMWQVNPLPPQLQAPRRQRTSTPVTGTAPRPSTVSGTRRARTWCLWRQRMQVLTAAISCRSLHLLCRHTDLFSPRQPGRAGGSLAARQSPLT